MNAPTACVCCGAAFDQPLADYYRQWGAAVGPAMCRPCRDGGAATAAAPGAAQQPAATPHQAVPQPTYAQPHQPPPSAQPPALPQPTQPPAHAAPPYQPPAGAAAPYQAPAAVAGHPAAALGDPSALAAPRVVAPAPISSGELEVAASSEDGTGKPRAPKRRKGARGRKRGGGDRKSSTGVLPGKRSTGVRRAGRPSSAEAPVGGQVSPVVAFLLSFFIFTGIGHFYVGRSRRGLYMIGMALGVGAINLTLFGLSILLGLKEVAAVIWVVAPFAGLAFHIYQTIDAVQCAQERNRGLSMRRTGTRRASRLR